MSSFPSFPSLHPYLSISVALFCIALLLSRYGPFRWSPLKDALRTGDATHSDQKDAPRPSPTSFQDAFPPSNRAALHRLQSAVKVDNGVLESASIQASTESASNIEASHRRIAWKADFRTLPNDTLLLSGITLGELRGLGDFPDFALLSDTPPIEEYEGFVLERAVHRPYRPFRWGYFQTMALHRLDHNYWLELTSNYAATVRERLEIAARHGTMIRNALPGSELACKESMEMALQFYTRRHPQFFRLTHDASQGWIFHNAILRQQTVLADFHPLEVLTMHVPEDFALMLRNDEDGKYYLRAGVICSAIGWNLGEKLGKELAEIHGVVPDYRAKMEFSMDRFFANLPVSRPIQRAAWGFEIGEPLFVPPNDPSDAWRAQQRADLRPSDISLRVDWQTLRRLPLSAGILFNYKAIFTPLEEMRDEPHVPALVAQVLTEGHKGIRKYKNTWHTEHVVVPAMQSWAHEQVARGLVCADWPVETLAESPFYPGWEARWRARQGF